MACRNYDLERTNHAARQKKADDKIGRQEDRMKGDGALPRSDEQQLMNEMRGNKAALDFNRALFDYDAEEIERQHCSA